MIFFVFLKIKFKANDNFFIFEIMKRFVFLYINNHSDNYNQL